MTPDYKLETGKVLRSTYAALLAERQAERDPVWSEIGRYVCPRKYKDSFSTPDTRGTDRTTPQVYDSTAIEGASILAAGHSSSIIPANTRWFGWQAPFTYAMTNTEKDAANASYNKAAQTVFSILGATNFYAEMTEVFDDRASFGVCCLRTDASDEAIFTFRAIPVGRFVMAEDVNGIIDTVFVSYDYSISSLCAEFGMEVVNQHKVLRDKYKDYMEKGVNSSHEVIHACFRRPAHMIDKTKLDSDNMPYANVWFILDTTDAEDGVLRKSGAHEQIYMVSRYLRKAGGSAYGFAPYENVRACVQDAQRLRRVLQVCAQRIAIPPLLIPEKLKGNVDTNPGGHTIIPSSGDAVPREWLTGADPKWLMELLAQNREEIRKAYHTDMFRMFSERSKQMTVREVNELASEKLMPFGPSFTRFVSDFRITMFRLFGIAMRSGLIGDESDYPEAVKVDLGDDLVDVMAPNVVYQSRMALAYKNQEIAATDRMLERVGAVAQARPDVWDNVDVDAAVRETARADGVPEHLLVPAKQIASQRKRAAESNAAAMLVQQMAQQAGAQGAQGPAQPGM